MQWCSTTLTPLLPPAPCSLRSARHRQLPVAIYHAKQRKHDMDQAVRRRVENKRKHSGEAPQAPERKRHIIARED